MKKVLFLVFAAAMVVACNKTPTPAPAPKPTAVVVPDAPSPVPPVPVATKPAPKVCKPGETKAVGLGGGKASCVKCNEDGTAWSSPYPCPVGTPVPVATKPPTPKPACKEGDMTGAVGTKDGPVCMKCVGGKWVEDLGCK